MVSAANALAEAAFFDGKQAQAFPAFGVERTGAPIEAFCRIDKKPVRLHQHVYSPDYLVVLDDSLLARVNVFDGLKKNGLAVVASKKKIKKAGFRVLTVDAFDIAAKHVGRPIVNMAVLGGFAKATGLVSMPSLEKAIRKVFEKKPAIAEKNVAAARECFQALKK